MDGHQTEIVTQEFPDTNLGYQRAPRHYLACSCGWVGELRRKFSSAIDDRAAHYEAIKLKEENGGGIITNAASDSSYSYRAWARDRDAQARSDSEVHGIRSADISGPDRSRSIRADLEEIQ